MGGRINFGVMLRSQHFYNKSYAKNLLAGKKNNIGIWVKFELVTAYYIEFVVKLL